MFTVMTHFAVSSCPFPSHRFMVAAQVMRSSTASHLRCLDKDNTIQLYMVLCLSPHNVGRPKQAACLCLRLPVCVCVSIVDITHCHRRTCCITHTLVFAINAIGSKTKRKILLYKKEQNETNRREKKYIQRRRKKNADTKRIKTDK